MAAGRQRFRRRHTLGAGSTGGTGDKNLNKQLFIPKTHDRVVARRSILVARR